MKFVVYAPDYVLTSAGTRALFRLCHWLNVMGHDASLTAHVGNPDWENPTWDGTIDADTVAIYPEVVHGNPLGAQHVVRWVLYYPGRLGGDTVYAADERVFWALPWFADAARAATPLPANACGLLYASTTHPECFYPGHRERDLDVVFLGKRAGEHFERAAEMARRPNTTLLHGLGLNDHALGYLLRRARTLYTFDEHTMLSFEARLCGTPVQVWDDGAWRPLDARDRFWSPHRAAALWDDAVHDYFHPTGIRELVQRYQV